MSLSSCWASAPSQQVETLHPAWEPWTGEGVPGRGGVGWHWVPGRGWGV